MKGANQAVDFGQHGVVTVKTLLKGSIYNQVAGNKEDVCMIALMFNKQDYGDLILLPSLFALA